MNETTGDRSGMLTGLAKGYAWLFLVLTICVYPLALLPQFSKTGNWFNNLAYNISLPVFLILGLMAVPVIVVTRWRVPLTITIGLIVFAACWLVNLPSISEYWDETATLLGCMTIPIVAAILREKGVLTLANLSYSALGLWILQILLGFAALVWNNPVVGTPGNRNWMAALLLVLSPWVFVALTRLMSRWLDRRSRIVVAAVILAVPTFILLYHCHSRAGWAAIVLAPLGLVFLLFRTRLEKGLFAGLLLTVIVGGLLIGYQRFPGKLLHVVKQDVRLPLWSNTVRMMFDHPWGVGAGQYQRTFTPYRIGTYHSRKYAADMTIHPHNEFLNLTAQLGIPVALALLLLVSPLIRGNFNSPLITCARLSALFVVFQSCFDMPLVQPPVSVLGFLMIGLCWPLRLTSQDEIGNRHITALLATGVGALAVSGYFCWHDVRSDYFMRAALLEKALGHKTMTDAEKYKKNKEIYDKFQDQVQKHYHRASDLFEKAVSPYRSVKAHYEMALIALNVEKDLDNAEKRLEHIRAIDRDYAHINILLGRLYLLKKDIRLAGMYFARECLFYPRNIDAWQTWYSFSFRSGQYNRCIDIHAQLEDIYREQAELKFPGDRVAAERTIFLDYLGDDERKAESIARGKGLLEQPKTMDPVFIDLTLNEDWPEKLLGNSVDELDYLYWRGRYKMWQQLLDMDQPLTVPELVRWFSSEVQTVPSDKFILPLMVSRAGRGDVASQYACFSDYINILGGQSIIELSDTGQPTHAWVFHGRIAKSRLPAAPDRQMSVVKLDFTGIEIFKVDLAKGTAEPVSLEETKATIEWKPGRTVVYFAPEEYFMRTQVLGAALGDEYAFLDTRPPSLRLLELFWITGKQPPAPPDIKDFCFRPPLELYKYFYNEAAQNIQQGIVSPPKKSE